MSHTRQPYGAQEPYGQQPQYGYPQQQGYPPQPGYYPQPQAQPHPRRKRRIFLWVFLAIQALFLIWLVTGLATVNTAAPASQVSAACYHHAWWPLFKSQADCVTHFGGALTDAGDAGKAIGAGLIVVFWCVVDVILGVTYGVYKLSTRGRRSLA
jgi:hypothetical protein